MSRQISGAEYHIAKIFSSDFEYHIPAYQRPYSWTEDQASELFEDLLSFHREEQSDSYFLGSIVLIKEEGKPHSEVIDGQQRLTALTILLAVIASRFDGELQEELKNRIVEPGKTFEGIEARPRLSLRDRDSTFFENYVQSLKLQSMLELDPISLGSNAQFLIRETARVFSSSIDDAFGTDLDALSAFAKFIVTRCVLVVVSTSSQQSAFRVFSVMNTRGIDLQSTDIIKADVIGGMTLPEDVKIYSDRWEQIETELGREAFNDLFSYLRMIFAQEKAKRTLLEEFRSHVWAKVGDSKKLIDELLHPFADALASVLNNTYVSSTNAEDVNAYLRWLGRIDNSDWIPPTIQFLVRFGDNSTVTLEFMRRLERMAAYLHICQKNVNERIRAYGMLIQEIDASDTGISLPSLELDDEKKAEMREALDGNIYELTARRRNYLILRLDSFLSDGAATYDSKIFTIEHVLPQTVPDDSEWAKWWPVIEDRKAWTHRIANLIPLNKRRNSAAQNYRFDRKCDAYFGGSKGISSYALTSQVLKLKSWGPDVVQNRQKELLEVLYKGWDL